MSLRKYIMNHEKTIQMSYVMPFLNMMLGKSTTTAWPRHAV